MGMVILRLTVAAYMPDNWRHIALKPVMYWQKKVTEGDCYN